MVRGISYTGVFENVTPEIFFPDGNLTRSRGLLLLSKKEITSTSTSVFEYLTGAETVFDRGFLQAEVRHVLLVN